MSNPTTYFVRRDVIDDDSFHLYVSGAPFSGQAKYHVATIHRDFIGDLLKAADPELWDTVSSMQPADEVELIIEVREVGVR